MAFDPKRLSEEERAQVEALLRKAEIAEGESEREPGRRPEPKERSEEEDHPDYQEDMEMIHPLIDGFMMLVERIESLEQIVYDELINPIKEMATQKARNTSIEGIRGKWGAQLEPHMEMLKALFGDDTDVFGKLHDDYGELPEEERDGKIKDFMDRLVRARGGKPVGLSIVKTEKAGEVAPPSGIENLGAQARKLAEARKKAGEAI